MIVAESFKKKVPIIFGGVSRNNILREISTDSLNRPPHPWSVVSAAVGS
jgi:tRNA A37 threonylcarbamoyltransferase TsaD